MGKLSKANGAGILCLALLAACSPSPSEQRGIKQGDTQIVAQWLDDPPFSFWGNLTWTFTTANYVTSACGPLCFVDGNDLGSGTRNLYIYAQPDDIEETINLLVELERTNRLPSGMRIGIAKYKDAKRTDWTYEPAYPKELKYFAITYSSGRHHSR